MKIAGHAHILLLRTGAETELTAGAAMAWVAINDSKMKMVVNVETERKRPAEVEDLKKCMVISSWELGLVE